MSSTTVTPEELIRLNFQSIMYINYTLDSGILPALFALFYDFVITFCVIYCKVPKFSVRKKWRTYMLCNVALSQNFREFKISILFVNHEQMKRRKKVAYTCS
jgi:hypothetical protein